MDSSRTLLVIRHAKSDQHAGVADHERPLNDRGRRDAPALGRWLAADGPQIGLVLCSSAVRAQQTWDLAAAQLQARPPLDVTDALYDASPREVLELLHEVDDDVQVVAVVGHEPTQSGVVGLLAGTGDPAAEAALREGFATSAVAVLDLSSGWSELAEGSAYLSGLQAPRG
ncbi:SixA phosphatase family protein [Angustibacter sp. McL0619]|uniref:SixA phosphatase family protein n=1 Tax=Angustibacter sp. McL0619 TaxID=3415676 RepID=UPI003CF6814D